MNDNLTDNLNETRVQKMIDDSSNPHFSIPSANGSSVDDERTIIFSSQDENSAKTMNSDDLILSKSDENVQQLETIRLQFLHDIHEGKPIDVRQYWRKASKENQVQCRLLLDNAWFRYFSADAVPKVDTDTFIQKAVQLEINSEDQFRSTLEGVLLSDDPCKRLQEAISRWILSGTMTSYQAQKIYMGRESDLLMGDYLILEFLGEGGMGRVLKAMHKPSQRVVALKIFDKSKDNSGSGITRFKREVMLAKRMMHPNIITAYDSGETEYYDYLAIEYVDGPDLSKMVKWEGPVPVEKAIHYMIQAAEALAYAHRQQVIHRDVKPHNMMVDDNDVLKILDLGLGRLSWLKNEPGEGGLTQTGQFLGTVDFLAPEQAVSARTADERSDIYALGATLYYILTGRVMFKGDSIVSKIFAHQNEERPSLLEFSPDIPQVLDHLYRRMTARDPKNRIQSMEEVSQYLKDIRDGKDIYILSVPDSDAFSRSATFKKDAAMGTSSPLSQSSTITNQRGFGNMSGSMSGSMSQGSFSGTPQNQSMASVGNVIGIGAGLLAVVLMVYLIYSIVQSKILPQGNVQITGLPDLVKLDILDAHGNPVPVQINPDGDKRSFKVSYGNYSFRAVAPYYRETRGTFTVDEPLESPIEAGMRYSSGIAFDHFKPENALFNILSEGKTVLANVPLTSAGMVQDLAPGTYQLQIQAPGWTSVQIEKKVEEGKTTSVHFELSLAQSITLDIPENVVPYDDVEITVRSKKQNLRNSEFNWYKKTLTPEEFAKAEWRTIPLLPGDFLIQARTTGFLPVEQSVLLKEAEPATAAIALEKLPEAAFLERLLDLGGRFTISDSKGQISPWYSDKIQWKGIVGETIENVDLSDTASLEEALNVLLTSPIPIRSVNATHAQTNAKTLQLIRQVISKFPNIIVQTIRDNINWQAAHSVLMAGGKVWIKNDSLASRSSSEEKELTLETIPDAPFQIVRIDLKQNEKIRKSELSKLAGLPSLQAICLSDVPGITPADLAAFAQNKSIDVYNKIAILPQRKDFMAIRTIQCADLPAESANTRTAALFTILTRAGNMQLWDLANLSPILLVNNVQTVALAPNGLSLAICSIDKTQIAIYQSDDQFAKPQQTIDCPFSPNVLVISNQGRLLLGASKQGDFAIWNRETGEKILQDTLKKEIFCAAINPQEDKFILGCEKNAYIYQVSNGALFGTLNADKEKITSSPVFRDLQFSPDDKAVFSNISGQSLNMWGMEGANSCRNMALLDSCASQNVYGALSINHPQNLLLAGGRNVRGFSGLTSYNIGQQNQKKDWTWKGSPIEILVCSPSGNMSAAVCGNQIFFIKQNEGTVAIMMISNEADKWVLFSPSGSYTGNDEKRLDYTSSAANAPRPVSESRFDLRDDQMFKDLFKNW